ncbi:LOW QUALITY PROTEIN: uncharacterized protein LOC111830927 [Capsella rubella]|uniref:LOW QUALITY PROTEIN: uncharacterized protein LOC111830927 n=1 Tax=Capsella rubella TaxID=81985 RepID=UPI000CD527AC|nr:LOW QUALITY PROTEIN: uncharacterized protein LOC111830927 [Capsella rubella]
MEVRHGALSTANENKVIIASAISSLSSCQINAMHGMHYHQGINHVIYQVDRPPLSIPGACFYAPQTL